MSLHNRQLTTKLRFILLLLMIRLGVVCRALTIAVLVALTVTAAVAAVSGGGAQVGHAIENYAEDIGARAVH